MKKNYIRGENRNIHTLFRRRNCRRPQSSLVISSTLAVNLTDGKKSASVGCTEKSYGVGAHNRWRWPREASIVYSSGWEWWQVRVWGCHTMPACAWSRLERCWWGTPGRKGGLVFWGERLAFNNLLLHRGLWFYICDLACAEDWNFSVPSEFPLKPNSPRADYEGLLQLITNQPLFRSVWPSHRAAFPSRSTSDPKNSSLNLWDRETKNVHCFQP